jgi:ATP-dependent DNA helicase RecG
MTNYLYKYAKAYGGTDPVIVEGDVLRIEVQTPTETAPKTTQENAQESTRNKIVELLRQNPKYTKADLMQILGKADGTIKEHLAKLKKEGKLKRVGSTKSGYWKVI